jgi:HEPN domain-containing protein
MEKEVKNWLDSAEYDLETAEHMCKTGRYIYAIFTSHLAIEKVFKAKVAEITGKMPPKTHSLRYLIKLSGLELSEDMFSFLSRLSDVSIPTRYPEDFGELVKSYDEETAKAYLIKTKEVFQWIKNCIRL